MVCQKTIHELNFFNVRYSVVLFCKNFVNVTTELIPNTCIITTLTHFILKSLITLSDYIYVKVMLFYVAIMLVNSHEYSIQAYINGSIIQTQSKRKTERAQLVNEQLAIHRTLSLLKATRLICRLRLDCFASLCVRLFTFIEQ